MEVSKGALSLQDEEGLNAEKRVGDEQIANIDKQIKELEEQLKTVKGTPTEVYTRIVGYFRAVDNWNVGKKAEYFDRKLFKAEPSSNCDHVCEECATEPGCASSRLDHQEIKLQEVACAC